MVFFFGDPCGNRTHITAVKGRCLNLLTNGPGSGNLIRTDDNTGMNRVLYQLSYTAIATLIIKDERRFVNRNFQFFEKMCLMLFGGSCPLYRIF